MKGDYGLLEWATDAFAASYQFGQIRWAAEDAACTRVKVIVLYRKSPNQKPVQRIGFDNVPAEELHTVKMCMVRTDREWQEMNLRIEGELAKVHGGGIC